MFEARAGGHDLLVLKLFQAEWCPYSAAVRERLTELGIDFIAVQVAPRDGQRENDHAIPLLVTDAGKWFSGTDAVFAYLDTLERRDGWERGHRALYSAHTQGGAQATTVALLAAKAPL